MTEDSLSDDELSTEIKMSGERYRVTHARTAPGERTGRLSGPDGVMATMEPAEKALIYSPGKYRLLPELPTRIDLLAIAVRTCFWMQNGVSANRPAGD